MTNRVQGYLRLAFMGSWRAQAWIRAYYTTSATLDTTSTKNAAKPLWQASITRVYLSTSNDSYISGVSTNDKYSCEISLSPIRKQGHNFSS